MTRAERILEVCRVLENGNMSKMASKIGVTPAYISKLKNNPESEPSDIFMKQVAIKYRISEDWLLNGKGDMMSEENDAIRNMVNEYGLGNDVYVFLKKFMKMPDEERAIILKFFTE